VNLIPEEGFSLACDDLVIPKAAKQVDLGALKFINFYITPEVAAANTDTSPISVRTVPVMPALAKNQE